MEVVLALLGSGDFFTGVSGGLMRCGRRLERILDLSPEEANAVWSGLALVKECSSVLRCLDGWTTDAGAASVADDAVGRGASGDGASVRWASSVRLYIHLRRISGSFTKGESSLLLAERLRVAGDSGFSLNGLQLSM